MSPTDRRSEHRVGSIFRSLYGFHLTGHATRLDLRQLPKTVPVPHMRSNLTFDYDATGRFQKPVLVGAATFDESTFLDAQISAGSHGTIDTRGERVTYSADGNARNLDIGQIGEEFDLATLREPQFAGTVGGDFNLAGAGSSLDDLTIDVKGTRVAAALFGGQFSEGDLDLQIRNDSLAGSGRGQFKRIDSAILVDDPRVAGTLNGRFDMKGSFPGLFGAGFDSSVSVVSGSLSVADSRLKGIDIQTATVAGEFDRGLATLTTGEAKTAIGTASGKGRLAISRGESDFTYDIDIADASQLKDFLSISAKGRGAFKGRAVGPLEQTRIDGTFTASDIDVAGISAQSASGNYHLEGSPSHLADLTISGDGSATFVSAFGRNLGNATAKLRYSQERLEGDLEAHLPDARVARISGNVLVHPEHNELHVSALRIELANERWVLSTNAGSPVVSWSQSRLSASDLVFDTGTGAPGRIRISGDLGRTAPAGSVAIKIENVPLQDLRPLVPAIAGYRGRLNATITIDGTLSDPGVSAEARIDEGGVRGFSFQSLYGSGKWTGDSITGDLRLDQSPGVWLTANGSVPIDLFSATSTKPVDVTVQSSTIQLALLEGLTPAVRNMVGTAQLNMTVKGQANDPRFDGFANVENASFEVPATGVRYRNGNAHITFVPEAVKIETLHLEDNKGNPLDLTGTAGTRALHLGELGFEVSATQFQALKNDLGDLVLNGVFTVTGTLPAPIVSGDLAVERATLDAGTLFLRLQRPYAVTAPDVDTVEPSAADSSSDQAPSPSVPGLSGIWDNLTLRLRLLTTNNLVIRGENMHLSREALSSIGDISVVFGGDLSIRKAPHEPVDVAGALQTVRGIVRVSRPAIHHRTRRNAQVPR